MDPAGSATLPRQRASLRDPLLVGGIGLGLFALLRLRDPHDSGTYGYCPVLVLTGHPCPGCGGLRAVNDLTHGDLVGAVSSNLVAVVLVAVLAVAWVLWVVRRLRGVDDRMIVLSAPVGLAVAGVLLAFGLIRLLPFAAWLQP